MKDRLLHSRLPLATTCFYVALILLLSAATLGAQSGPTDSSAASSTPPTLALVQPALRERVTLRVRRDSLIRAPTDTPSTGEVFGRVGLGGAGVILGGLGGGLLGYLVLPHSDCNCDDPGLREYVIGAAVGGAVGAALAAAIPTQRSDCSYGRRAVYGLLGAVAGGALGVVAPDDQRVVFIPLGAAVGAGVLSAFCG